MNKFFITVSIFFGLIFTSFGQTQDEVRNFINKSPISIWKAQKELHYRTATQYASELREAYKNQLYAIELFHLGKTEEALDYSYAAREKAMNLLASIGVKVPKETLIETFETKFFIRKQSFKPNAQLEPSQMKRLAGCNVLNATETSVFSLQILK